MIETLKQIKSEIQPLVGADVTERNALNEIEFKLMQLISVAEQPAQQEPVGEAQQMSELVEGFTHCIWDARAVPIGTKLYTTPQAQPAPEIAIADAYRAGVDSGIAAEREACAEMCSDIDGGENMFSRAIRARGNT